MWKNFRNTYLIFFSMFLFILIPVVGLYLSDWLMIESGKYIMVVGTVEDTWSDWEAAVDSGGSKTYYGLVSFSLNDKEYEVKLSPVYNKDKSIELWVEKDFNDDSSGIITENDLDSDTALLNIVVALGVIAHVVFLIVQVVVILKNKKIRR